MGSRSPFGPYNGHSKGIRSKSFKRVRHTSSVSAKSPSAKAAQAFKTQQCVNYKNSTFFYDKGTYNAKNTLLLTAGATVDLALIRDIMSDASGVTGTRRDYSGVKNIKNTYFIKNVSTYQIRVRVSTWVCRHEVGYNAEGWTDLADFYAAGFVPPYTATPSGGQAVTSTDISGTVFQNPLWVQYFKCVKVRGLRCGMPCLK